MERNRKSSEASRIEVVYNIGFDIEHTVACLFSPIVVHYVIGNISHWV